MSNRRKTNRNRKNTTSQVRPGLVCTGLICAREYESDESVRFMGYEFTCPQASLSEIARNLLDFYVDGRDSCEKAGFKQSDALYVIIPKWETNEFRIIIQPFDTFFDEQELTIVDRMAGMVIPQSAVGLALYTTNAVVATSRDGDYGVLKPCDPVEVAEVRTMDRLGNIRYVNRISGGAVSTIRDYDPIPYVSWQCLAALGIDAPEPPQSPIYIFEEVA